MAELAGRAALVTGAGRNIGRAIARELAAAGAAVAVNARSSRDEAEAVVAEIRAAGGRAVAVLADVAERPAVDAMLAGTLGAFGRLDILVNNAALRREVPFADLSFPEWSRVLAVCLDGAFHCTQAALPALLASDAGAVVNIGGLTGHAGAGNRAHVVAAKAGLAGLTRALAHELSPRGVTVNLVAPGLIATRREAGHAPAHRAGRATLTGRQGLPEEIAAAVSWLAGPNARYVTGQCIHVNGGAYLGG